MKRKQTLEQKQAAMRNIQPFQWPKGITGHSKGRKMKKVMAEYLALGLDYSCPDEWLAGALVGLKGTGPDGGNPTIGFVMSCRLLYHGVTGSQNKGLSSAVEVINRTEGKVPLPVVSKEPERDGTFTGLTEEELNEEIKELAKKVKGLLPELTDEKPKKPN